jgi:hypothetical protein
MKASQLIEMLAHAIAQCGDDDIIFQNVKTDELSTPIAWGHDKDGFFLEHVDDEDDLRWDT